MMYVTTSLKHCILWDGLWIYERQAKDLLGEMEGGGEATK